MAGKAEVWPRGENDPDFYPEIQEPTRLDNFKTMVEVYLSVRRGEDIEPDFIRTPYRNYLLNDSNGQATAKALDELRASSTGDWLFEEVSVQLANPELMSRGDEAFDELIGRTAAHLPPGLGIEILLDPRMADEAA